MPETGKKEPEGVDARPPVPEAQVDGPPATDGVATAPEPTVVRTPKKSPGPVRSWLRCLRPRPLDAAKNSRCKGRSWLRVLRPRI